MMTWKNIKALLLIVGALLIIFLLYFSINTYKEKNRLQKNQSALLVGMQRYKILDSLNAAKVGVLTLSIGEIKANKKEDLKDITKLGISNNDLVAYSKAELQQSYNINSKLRDSLIRVKANVKGSLIHDTTTQYIDTCKTFNYKSKWFDAQGLICKDNISLRAQSRDSLVSVEHTIPKKIWFIRLPKCIFGYKSLQYDIYSKNPNTSIMGIEYVKTK